MQTENTALCGHGLLERGGISSLRDAAPKNAGHVAAGTPSCDSSDMKILPEPSRSQSPSPGTGRVKTGMSVGVDKIALNSKTSNTENNSTVANSEKNPTASRSVSSGEQTTNNFENNRTRIEVVAGVLPATATQKANGRVEPSSEGTGVTRPAKGATHGHFVTSNYSFFPGGNQVSDSNRNGKVGRVPLT